MTEPYPIPEPLNGAGVHPDDPSQDGVGQDPLPVIGDVDALPGGDS